MRRLSGSRKDADRASVAGAGHPAFFFENDMTPEQLADFCFCGAAVLPEFLLVADQPALALMGFLILIAAGCLYGGADPDAPFRTAIRAEQVRKVRKGKKSRDGKGGGSSGPPS
jgi:hypothetical protein